MALFFSKTNNNEELKKVEMVFESVSSNNVNKAIVEIGELIDNGISRKNINVLCAGVADKIQSIPNSEKTKLLTFMAGKSELPEGDIYDSWINKSKSLIKDNELDKANDILTVVNDVVRGNPAFENQRNTTCSVAISIIDKKLGQDKIAENTLPLIYDWAVRSVMDNDLHAKVIARNSNLIDKALSKESYDIETAVAAASLGLKITNDKNIGQRKAVIESAMTLIDKSLDANNPESYDVESAIRLIGIGIDSCSSGEEKIRQSFTDKYLSVIDDLHKENGRNHDLEYALGFIDKGLQLSKNNTDKFLKAAVTNGVQRLDPDNEEYYDQNNALAVLNLAINNYDSPVDFVKDFASAGDDYFNNPEKSKYVPLFIAQVLASPPFDQFSDENTLSKFRERIELITSGSSAKISKSIVSDASDNVCVPVGVSEASSTIPEGAGVTVKYSYTPKKG